MRQEDWFQTYFLYFKKLSVRSKQVIRAPPLGRHTIKQKQTV